MRIAGGRRCTRRGPERDRDAGERRQVTVLFANLTGFTKLS